MGMPRITNGGPERARKRTLGEREGEGRSWKQNFELQFRRFRAKIKKNIGNPQARAQSLSDWGAFDSAKNHKRQRRNRQSVTAKREKSHTPKFV